VSRVGVQDDFFEVGGDSILAIQVVARAQEAGLQLTAYDLFAHPTVEGLAEVAGAAVRVDAEQGEVTGPVFLAPTQWWFSQASPADRHHWNTSVLVRLHVPVDAAVVATGVERLLAHHDGLRQRFLLSAANSRARGSRRSATRSRSRSTTCPASTRRSRTGAWWNCSTGSSRALTPRSGRCCGSRWCASRRGRTASRSWLIGSWPTLRRCG
jgi:aryl carrier-like protein